MKGRTLIAAVIGAVIANALGGLSAALSGPMAGGEWYESLARPALQPPGPVFGIAWTILYTLLGIAASRLWLAPASPARSRALTLFLVQLALNLAWSPLFFAGQQLLAALVLLGAILLLSVAATVAAARVDRPSPWLMLPYLVWLSFAFGLNWRIWALNPGA